MNTAKMREKARMYEAKLDWANAALCWADAIALLPTTPSGLNDLDRRNMTSSMLACQLADKRAATPAWND